MGEVCGKDEEKPDVHEEDIIQPNVESLVL